MFDLQSSLDDIDIGGNLCEEGEKNNNANQGGSDDGDGELVEGSSSDTGSSEELIVDPFSLMEMWDKVESVDAKVDIVNAQFGMLHSKTDLVLQSIFEIKAATPSLQIREQQLDQLISLRIKHTLEES